MPKRILTGGDRVQVLALMASQLVLAVTIFGVDKGHHPDETTEAAVARANELLEAVEAHELAQQNEDLMQEVREEEARIARLPR
jgi:uncharacterized membrane protein